MKEILWNIYAHTYDTTTLNFSEYRRLLKDLEESIDLQDNDVVINLGCGTGNLEKQIENSQKNFTWVGLDISKKMLALAKKKVQNNKIRFAFEDMDKPLDIENEIADKVISIHSLYTVTDPDHSLEEIRRILKMNGKLIIVNPKKNVKSSEMFAFEKKEKGLGKLILFMIRVLPALIVNIFIIKMANDKRKYHFFEELEIKKLLEKHSFEIQEFKYVYANQSHWIIALKK